MSQIINLATMSSITTDFDNAATVYGAPVRVQGGNAGLGEMNVQHLFASAGSATFGWTVQLSNDGENWTDSTMLTDTTTAEGVVQVAGDIFSAYIRMKFTLSVGGQTGDWGSVCFCFKLNIIQK